MNLSGFRQALDVAATGAELHELCREVLPICRSITGDGVRDTLAIVQKHLPLEVHEVPSGTRVLDWEVPREWNIRDAYVVDATGRRVVDFARSNLHVLNYSVPVKARMPLSELQEHLFSLPDRPDWVPYRTSYYREEWGFCLSHNDREALDDGDYDVVIDTTLEDGSLTYGECHLAGGSADEILVTTHVCHPSMANDNASGIATLTKLGSVLQSLSLRYSYRLLFIPGTIGSIAWLARNDDVVSRIRHGLVVTGTGDPGALVYKRSRRGDADIDRAAAHVIANLEGAHRVIDFYPYGYDERQFCSPGFDLPVGRFGRTPHGEYPEYHTSADDLGFVSPAQIGDAFEKILAILEVLEGNDTYVNLQPKGEPQLGRRGLYRAVGGDVDQQSVEMALLWVLNLSDGRHSLLDIAEQSGLPFATLRRAADALADHDLLGPLEVARTECS